MAGAGKLRVMMMGLRGFPNVQGGVETHAEQLCLVLARSGCEVEVVARAPFLAKEAVQTYDGITFTRLWSPRKKGIEAFVHTFLAVLLAGVRRPDVVHIHAIGPAIVTPLARILGLRVVVTHHGPDYDREKWGAFPRWVLRTGERLGMRWSNERIVISKVIRDLVRSKHGKESTLIPNGVIVPELPDTKDSLEAFGLEPGRYILLVSRFVKEKRHLDLIEAFSRSGLKDWKLVLVGGSDHADPYVGKILSRAEEAEDVVCTGVQTGTALRELYGHAGIFVLPSSHEGLPIALLEALSYGLPVLASDIPANLEVGLDHNCYFPLGNVEALSRALAAAPSRSLAPNDREARRNRVREKYNWDRIGADTAMVYARVCHKNIEAGSLVQSRRP